MASALHAVNTIEQRVAVHLMGCAIQRQTTTYEELAIEFGLPTQWPQLGKVLSAILYNIYDWCELHRLPKLTVLVVRKSGADMSLPGGGFWKAAGLEHITRGEKVLLTEMWTTDVYDYFGIEATH